MAFTSANDPDAIPDIIAACSRGKAYEPTFKAYHLKSAAERTLPRDQEHRDHYRTRPCVKPKANEQTVNKANNPIGRRFSAAKRSATLAPKEITDAPGERRHPDRSPLRVRLR
jgi:hypothetical protein